MFLFFDPYLNNNKIENLRIINSLNSINEFDIIVKLVKHKIVEKQLEKIKFNKNKFLKILN